MRPLGAIYPWPLDDGSSADLAPRLNMRLDLWSLRLRRLAAIRRRADGPQVLAWWPFSSTDGRWTK